MTEVSSTNVSEGKLLEPDVVERVAKEIYIWDQEQPGRAVRYNCGWRALPSHLKDKYLKAARAAIAAMRPAVDWGKVEEIRQAYDEWRGADTLCGILADPEDEGSPEERQESAEHAAWAWDQAAGKFMLYGDKLLEMLAALTPPTRT